MASWVAFVRVCGKRDTVMAKLGSTRDGHAFDDMFDSAPCLCRHSRRPPQLTVLLAPLDVGAARLCRRRREQPRVNSSASWHGQGKGRIAGPQREGALSSSDWGFRQGRMGCCCCCCCCVRSVRVFRSCTSCGVLKSLQAKSCACKVDWV